MKSNQINFFYLPEEVGEIEDFLKEKGYVFIKQPIIASDEIFLLSLASTNEDKNLFSKVFITKPKFLSELYLNEIQSRNYFLVDDIKSYVIEFTRGGFLFDNERLERARFYFVKSYFHHNEKLEKGNEFIDNGNNLIREFKKRFLKRDKLSTIFYTKRIMDLVTTGKFNIDSSGLYMQINNAK